MGLMLGDLSLRNGGFPGHGQELVMGVCEFVPLSFASGPRRAANIAGFQRSMTGFCQTVQQYPRVVTGRAPTASPTMPASTAPLRSWPASRWESRAGRWSWA